ncbi:hypothetical protein A6046_05205 [[Haemophilus] ducreyi]|uniref:Uncharacterized protein n=2 Tax=Haemophilus ducreyi TaxID=730 RepID=Q7VNK3_HAEDU|nr:hypothetical protein [[Haemophilus] ducreyi]AAP95456.1 hypothetical protein HD_0507 [[Haemophilus] ducreyi 35000HP]AKO30558.1 hypothetical protein RY60_02000 [[Haemophilus] ducreyi]AKO31995.1 hypothetical protein RZ57_02005 [[Haemophilus] ducreyi]AKO33450.1 hypothetical protein RZ58_02005 [[Haemophilus] ducreyi]AKO34897.1 hypothetical protein RZ59_01990 [[Haemophilus] ducreyi]
MNKRKHKQTDSEKLDLILAATAEINEKVDKQNGRIDELQSELHKTRLLLDEMSRKNRKQAIIAGGVGGGLVAIGFELLRLKLGM